MLLRKTGLKTKGLDATASDKTLEKERQTFTREGEKEHGFTSSVVPTLEEKLIMEQLKKEGEAPKFSQNGTADPSHSDPHGDERRNGGATAQNDDTILQQNGDASRRQGTGANGVLQHDLRDDPSEAHAGGQLYGAPANTDPKRDDRVPGVRSDGTDTEDEEKAPGARKTIRKNLSAKLSSSKQWTLPTPAPHVDPHGFEDPVCDAFWKKTWLACAVHNVSIVAHASEVGRANRFLQTEVFRKVFHAVPDDLVTTWKQYKEFIVHHERLNRPVSVECMRSRVSN